MKEKDIRITNKDNTMKEFAVGQSYVWSYNEIEYKVIDADKDTIHLENNRGEVITIFPKLTDTTQFKLVA